MLSDMQTNVSTLLREFPKIRRAAMRGERVIIKTREGNLILEAEKSVSGGILGTMKEVIIRSAEDLDRPTTEDWSPSL